MFTFLFLLMTALLATASDANPFFVIPKNSWGKTVDEKACKPHTIQHISIHHTATPSTNNRKTPSRIRGYQRYHQSKGWMDIAYHFLIDLEGNIYQGRNIECAGDTATNYDPTGHLLIVMEGNFEQQQPTPKALRSLAQLMTWGSHTYTVAPTQFFQHRDLAKTKCPGKHLSALLASDEFTKQLAVIHHTKFTLKLLSVEEGKDKITHIKSNGK